MDARNDDAGTDDAGTDHGARIKERGRAVGHEGAAGVVEGGGLGMEAAGSVLRPRVHAAAHCVVLCEFECKFCVGVQNLLETKHD